MTTEDPKTEIELAKSRAPEPKPDARRRKLRKIGGLVAGFAAVGTVLAGLTGYWTTYRTVTREILAPVVGVDDKLAKAPRLSLVVLPFANLSGDPEQDYFAQALTADLTTDLSHYFLASFVIAHSTALTYKGQAVDPKQLGRELGVRYVLEGSVQRVGETINVNAQLISTESGTHIWAERLEAERNRLGDLRTEFVSRLARSMGWNLMNVESLRAMRERPTNPDAVDLTMRGWLTMGHHLPEDLKKAIGYFDQSLRLDPDYLEALVGKGICQLVLSWHFQIGDPQEVTRDVEHSMDHVLAANPKDPRAHMAKATISEWRGQYDAALAQLNAAIESDPSFAEAHAEIGNVMISLGRAEDAFKPIELALRLDPLANERFLWELYACRAHAALAEWDQAIEWCEKSVVSNPALPWPYLYLAGAYGWLGRAAEASAALAELQKRYQGLTVQKYLGLPSANPKAKSQMERIAEGLRKAGLPER
jgi:TolB-like protein/Tfp pilus assembly protein PilF